MTEDQALAFVKALGGKHISTKSGWVTSSCVLARWTHKNGTDNNPSFGLSVDPGKASHWNCYSCGSGSVEELLGGVEFHLAKNNQDPKLYGLDILAARTLLDSEEVLVQTLPEYQEFQPNEQHEFQEWPAYWIDSFLPAVNNQEALAYLNYRGVTAETAMKRDLRWDYKRRMIVFPYHNVYGKFAGARGRAIDPGVEGFKKHYDYQWNKVNNSKLCWYNEQSLQLPGPVVVVEGQFDVLQVLKVYPKVVGNLTAKPVMSKMGRLLQSDALVHIPDNDGPTGTGDKSIAWYQGFCASHGLGYRLIKLPLPEHESKIDPGECSPEYLFDRLQELNIV